MNNNNNNQKNNSNNNNNNNLTSHNNIPQKQIINFKQYLDTKGSQLAKTSQFLQFYALPFVKNPIQHSKFKILFTKNWINNLKEKLITYLDIEQTEMKSKIKQFFNNNKNENKQSQIKQTKQTNNNNISIKQSKQQKQKQSTIVQPQSTIHKQKTTNNNNNNYQQKLKTLQQKNQSLFKQLQQIHHQYQQLQQNHQSMIQSFNQYMIESQSKWFENTKDLVAIGKVFIEIINNTNISNAGLERKYMKNKKKIEKYQKFVNKKFEDLMSISQDISIFDKPSMNQISSYTIKSGLTSKSWLKTQKNYNITNNNISNTNNISNINLNNNIISTNYLSIQQYIPTNYNKLNLQLTNNINKLSITQKQLIISGINWRIIKSKNKTIRRLFVISLIEENFLGLNKYHINKQTNEKELEFVVKYLGSNKGVNIKEKDKDVGSNKMNNNNEDRQMQILILEFLNNIKKDYYARDYLFNKHSTIIQKLIQMLSQSLQPSQPHSPSSQQYQSQTNLIIFRQLIDILSSISVYKNYRNKMIQLQLPTYLLDILQEYPILFENFEIMESIMICLINFAATEEGLLVLENNPNVFTILSDAFYSKFTDIKMLVSGMYYTMLGKQQLYDIALQANLPQFIQYLLNSPQQQSNYRQLKFLQQRLKTFQQSNQQSQQIQDTQSQTQQILEFQEDEIENLDIFIKGHQYLTAKYMLKGKQGDEQLTRIKKVEEEFEKQCERKMKENKQLDVNKRGNQQEYVTLNNNNYNNNIQISDKFIPVHGTDGIKGRITALKQDGYINKNNINITNNKQAMVKKNLEENNSNSYLKNQQQSTKHKQKQQIEDKNNFKIVKDKIKSQQSNHHNNNNIDKTPSEFIKKQSNFIQVNDSNINPPAHSKYTTSGINLNSPKNEKQFIKSPNTNQLKYNYNNSSSNNKNNNNNNLLHKGKGKQLLKQINEQIKLKKGNKVNNQHINNKNNNPHSNINKQKQKIKNKSSILYQEDQNIPIIQKYKQQILNVRQNQQNNNKRKNLHINLNNNNVQIKQQQLKAFTAKPKINRTPPKDEQITY